MKALIEFSEKPVICGVGGGMTVAEGFPLKWQFQPMEMLVAAIIVNQPYKNKYIEAIKRKK
ncbi:MAG: hypothetical protein IPH20_25165 [Bacteroidales bacterium]|nr:hypothetical protein [Bacteroidales bacterium]